jgi:hypothetical protein
MGTVVRHAQVTKPQHTRLCIRKPEFLHGNYFRFRVNTSVLVLWVLTPCGPVGRNDVSEEHIAFTLMVE